MKIDTIDIFHVEMPMKTPFRTAFGVETAIGSVLVRLGSAGERGWGESSPGSVPMYCAESAATAFLVARNYLAPLLLGREIESGTALTDALAPIKGNPFAKAAIDAAWWDLAARIEGLPLHEMLGGRRTVIDAGADFGVLDTIDDLVASVGDALGDGYRRVKLKIAPGWDVAPVEAVRSAFPDVTLHVDGNSGYTLDDVDIFKRLDRFNLAMIEQPLAHDDLLDHSYLQTLIDTPICLDESIYSPDCARKAAFLKACRWANIKPGRVGGMTNARIVHDIFFDAGIPCWVGGMMESAVGAAHCLALATLPNMAYPADIFPSDRFYARDLGTPPMVHDEPGRFHVRPGPGIGAEPDTAVLDELTVEKASFGREEV